MRKELSRDRVSGFLHAEGKTLVNGRGEPVLLLGWGLGNWLLCEGYMWGMGDVPQFDRPRRMEAALDDLLGPKAATRFWPRFRDSYITQADLDLMAEMGYNSLRVPIGSRLFLTEENGIHFREEGFRILDKLLDGCEKAGLYVWIDMHGAPGGQTGANIDDSADDLCRLLIDDAQFRRGVALWEEIARRYQERWIVAGYDLLNEPIRPIRFVGDTNLDGYEFRLRQFYVEAIAAIRKHDQKHLVSLEGKHWATDLAIFDRKYDDQMVLQFHRYGCPPEMSSLKRYLDAANRLNVPLWLGETGENTLPWNAAMVPLALDQGIHVTLWPWKKMETENSPCSYRAPQGWNELREFLKGGTRPADGESSRMMEELLRNVRAENCVVRNAIYPHLLRIPGCTVQGTDFDEGRTHAEGTYMPGPCRRDSGMEILPREENPEKQFPFDSPWRGASLRLHAGEWAEYTFHDVTSSCRLEIKVLAEETAGLEVYQGERMLGSFDISGCEYDQILSGMHPTTAERCVLRLRGASGAVRIKELRVAETPV